MEGLTKLLLLVNALLLYSLAECFVLLEPRLSCDADEEEAWSYHGKSNGPSEWGDNYPICYGREQSPVAIYSHTVKKDPNLMKLSMKNYDELVKSATIENNGHTVKITPTDGVNRTIEVNGATFYLKQLHFHWGSVYYTGSEHTVNDMQYAMEGHFVHLDSQNRIAVVGVLFQAASQWKTNTEIKSFVTELSHVRYKGNKGNLKKSLNLNKILPSNPASFFRYNGSLTTPGCDEGVVWSVLSELVPIGPMELLEFRKIYSTSKEEASAGCKMWNNFRPLQPLNERDIYISN